MSFLPEDRFSRAAWRRLLKGHSLALIAEREGQALGAGLLLFRTNSKIARLYTLSVSPQARGQGVAGALLTALETRAKLRKCTRFSLEVRASNQSAIHVYERAGFALKARVPDYYPDGETALKMEKALLPSDFTS